MARRFDRRDETRSRVVLTALVRRGRNRNPVIMRVVNLGHGGARCRTRVPFRLGAAFHGEFVLEGAANLIGLDQLNDTEKLKRLFEAFTRQRDILHLLDQSMHGEGVQIFIGHESGYQLLDECSVVAAPYTTADEVAGVLGVIGPTRMAYERVIPIVDITAKLLSAALKPRA